MAILGELKDRKVIQWVVGYGAAAWVVAQVAEVVADPWGIPAGWIRLLHLLLLAGLPLAAVLAWYHGASGRQGFRRSEAVILGAIVLLSGGVIATLDTSRFEPGPETGIATTAPGPASAAHALLADIPEDVPRLAVLGFTNLGEPEHGFFADGVTAELASRLSGLRMLAMISPNSARNWDPEQQGAGEFGKALGADYVLAGTVLWDSGAVGATVRVIPSLVRVADDTQVWSARIERPFDDALSLQSELAGQVAEQLAIGLSRAEEATLRQSVTQHPLAYETYLRAIQVLPQGHGAEADFRSAHTLLTQATTLDPDFLEAWAALAEANLSLYWFGYDVRPERLELGRVAMERALALDPKSDVARLQQADYVYRQRKFDEALALFAELYADRPNDAQVLQRLGYIWRRQGLIEPGIEALERSVELDPFNAYLLVELAWTYMFVESPDRTLELAQRAREQDPNAEWTPLMLAAACWTQGGPEALVCGREQLERAPDALSPYPAWFWILQLKFEGDLEGALLRAENYPDEALVGQAFWVPRDLVRGRLLMTLGRELEGRPLVEQSVVTLRRAIEQNPKDFRLYLSLGRALAALGQSEEAVTLAAQAAALMPVAHDAMIGPEVLYAQAEVCALAGAQECALDLLAKVLGTPTFHRNVWWTHNPAFAGLWDTPRFRALMEQAGANPTPRPWEHPET